MKRNYCSNQATSKNAFLGAGYSSPALKMIFNFIQKIYLIQKNSTTNGLVFGGGLSAGSDVRIFYSEVRTWEPAGSPPTKAGPSAVLFFWIK